MKPKPPRDIHWLVALRERNAWVGGGFFIIGLGLFGYLLFEALF